jgi:hypothetical protein
MVLPTTFTEIPETECKTKWKKYKFQGFNGSDCSFILWSYGLWHYVSLVGEIKDKHAASAPWVQVCRVKNGSGYKEGYHSDPWEGIKKWSQSGQIGIGK